MSTHGRVVPVIVWAHVGTNASDAEVRALIQAALDSGADTIHESEWAALNLTAVVADPEAHFGSMFAGDGTDESETPS